MYGRNRTLLILVNFACLGCFIRFAQLEFQSKHEATDRKLSPDEKIQIIKSVAVLESRRIDWDGLRERYHEYITETRRRRLSMEDYFLSTSSSEASLRSYVGKKVYGIDSHHLDETTVSETLNLATAGNRQNISIAVDDLDLPASVGDRTANVALDESNGTTMIGDPNVVVTVRDTNLTTGDGNQANDDAIGVDDDVIPNVSGEKNDTVSFEPSVAPLDQFISMSPSVESTKDGVPTETGSSVSEVPSIQATQGSVPTGQSATVSMFPSVGLTIDPTKGGTPTQNEDAVGLDDDLPQGNNPTSTPTTNTDAAGSNEPTSKPSDPSFSQIPTKIPSATPSAVIDTSRPSTTTSRPSTTPSQPTKPPSRRPTTKPSRGTSRPTPKPISSPNRVQSPVPTGNTQDIGGVVIPVYRYSRGNCPDKGSTGLACAPDNLAELCSKYDTRNRGSFSACLRACEPSFCCIHDAPEKTNPVAPTCHKDENCAQYAACYIVWWKIHDTIGPAPYLHLSQNDDFFNVDTLQNFTTDQAFYEQWAYHHWDNINELLSSALDDVESLQSLFANPMVWEPGHQ
jgi:hypothetical protein